MERVYYEREGNGCEGNGILLKERECYGRKGFIMKWKGI